MAGIPSSGTGGRRQRHARLRITTAVAMLVVGVAAFSPNAALAGGSDGKTSASAQYGKKNVIKPVVKGVSTSNVATPSPKPVPATSETLPLTGVSLLGVVVIGFGLMGLGALLVRRKDSRR